MPNHEVAKPLARNKGCEVLGHFADVLCEELKRHGLLEHDANETAANVMVIMKKEFGGQNIYFPTGSIASNEEKTLVIYEQFQAGKTIPELVFETGHSTQWVYQLIAKARAIRKAEREAQRQAG